MAIDYTPIKGIVVVRLFDSLTGALKNEQTVYNLITDTGDEYYTKRGISAVVPAAPADQTKVTGMKLGTGTATPGKNTTGHVLGTYISASNNPFDTSYPVANNLGAGLGWEAEYRTTWAAGDVTNSAITEAVIVNDATTDATSTAANTTARIKFTAIDKQANDILIISWRHKFLGA